MSSITVPPIPPKPNVDCVDLHRAFHGIGCDAAAVIDILAHRAAEHRAAIKEIYRNMYGEDLFDRLKSELHHKFEKSMLLWMRDPPSRDAYVLRDAMSLRGLRKKSILMETICLRSPSERRSASEAYSLIFNRSLIEDLRDTTEGPFRKIVEAYLVASPEESANLTLAEVEEEADRLYSAGEGRTSLDQKYFIQLLTSRSIEVLQAIFDSYKDMYGHGISKALKKAHGNSCDESAKDVIEVIKCVSNPAKHFAKVLRKSMKGLGTDDSTLIRVVVTRSEIDMRDIKSEFIRKYKVSLDRTIHSDTSGNYRRFLLTLIGSTSVHHGSVLSRVF